MNKSLTSDYFMLLVRSLLLYFCVHPNYVKAVRNSQDANKENQEENFDVYEDVNYHSYESCSLLEHSHKIK